MRRNLASAIIVFFIISSSFAILLYGINMVSSNMNSLYLSSQSSYSSYSQAKDTIPAFINLHQTEPYIYEITLMGSGFRINLNGLYNNIIYLRDYITYFIQRNI